MSSTQRTVQTVQQKKPYFEVAVDTDGQWHWMLWSANGRAMAMNTIKYPRKKDVLVAVRAIRQTIQEATIIVQSHEQEIFKEKKEIAKPPEPAAE